VDLLDGIAKGFSAVELRWQNGRQGTRINGHQWVHQKQFFFDTEGLLKLITPEAPMGMALTPAKFVLHQYQAKSGHPARGGILRVAAWSYLFKNYSVKDWLTFAEVYGMPMRIGEYEPGASKEDKDALFNAVRMLGADAAAIISSATKIRLEHAEGKTGEVYEKLHDTMNREMSKAILGQTLTVDTTGSTGTYAAGKVHERVREDLRDADAEALADTVQRDIVLPLVGFNFGWDAVETAPTFEFVIEEAEDLEAAARTVSTLVKDMGVKAPKKWVHDKFKIPMPQGDEEVYEGAPQAAPPEAGAMAARFASAGRADTSPLDDLAERAASAASSRTADMLAAIAAAAADSSSYEEAFERIASLYPKLRMSELDELLAAALVNSDLYGRWGVSNGR
jgi:phage gp29-like protein